MTNHDTSRKSILPSTIGMPNAQIDHLVNKGYPPCLQHVRAAQVRVTASPALS
jgi:hypothetical protein